MELTFECPKCQALQRVSDLSAEARVVCDRCGQARPEVEDAVGDGGLHRCAVCATEEFYIQKDFPHRLGLAIVLVGFAISTAFWYHYMPLSALGVLLASALLDMVLYYVVPDVTICYRCLSQYRGEGANPDGRYAPFDLAIGERYRQERLRAEELRQRQASAQPLEPT